MNIRGLLILCAASVLVARPAAADDGATIALDGPSSEPPPPLVVTHGTPLTLSEAFDAAIRSNPGLAAGEEQVVQARIGRDQAFSLISPQISASALYRVNDREISFDQSEATSAITDAFGGVYQNFGLIYGNMFQNGQLDAADCESIAAANGFADCAELTAATSEGFQAKGDGGDGGSTEPLVVSAKTQGFLSAEAQWPLSPRVVPMALAGKHQIDGAVAQLERNKVNLLLGVTQAFAAAYQAQEGTGLLQSQLLQVGAHLRNVEALVAAGMATRDQLLRARLEIEKVKRLLRQNQQRHRSALRQLALSMGSPSREIGAVAPLPDFAVDASVSADALITEAIERREDLRAARSQELTAKQLVIDAALQFLPTVALTGRFDWLDRPSGFDTKQTSWNVGVAASLPIWDGGLKIQNARNVSSRRRQAALNIRTTEERIEVEVADALDAWQTAKDSVPVAHLEGELAAESLRLVRARYQAGDAREVAVIDATSALQAAGLAILQTEVSLQVAAAQLLAATGRLGLPSAL